MGYQSIGDLTGITWGSWVVLGPSVPDKTTFWWCQCKCGFKQVLTRKNIRHRRYYRPSGGCRECIYAAKLGKGNVKHTREDMLEVVGRIGLGNQGGINRWSKCNEGDRMESNRTMNVARLEVWADRAARGQTKSQRSKWSTRFKNQVDILKEELEAAKNGTK